jgi:hypothetical protein
LDFGCGFGFLNPKSKLNQNIQKTKKPHPNTKPYSAGTETSNLVKSSKIT